MLMMQPGVPAGAMLRHSISVAFVNSYESRQCPSL
jgi:hypothetical protein